MLACEDYTDAEFTKILDVNFVGAGDPLELRCSLLRGWTAGNSRRQPQRRFVEAHWKVYRMSRAVLLLLKKGKVSYFAFESWGRDARSVEGCTQTLVRHGDQRQS